MFSEVNFVMYKGWTIEKDWDYGGYMVYRDPNHFGAVKVCETVEEAQSWIDYQ